MQVPMALSLAQSNVDSAINGNTFIPIDDIYFKTTIVQMISYSWRILSWLYNKMLAPVRSIRKRNVCIIVVVIDLNKAWWPAKQIECKLPPKIITIDGQNGENERDTGEKKNNNRINISMTCSCTSLITSESLKIRIHFRIHKHMRVYTWNIWTQLPIALARATF